MTSPVRPAASGGSASAGDGSPAADDEHRRTVVGDQRDEHQGARSPARSRSGTTSWASASYVPRSSTRRPTSSSCSRARRAGARCRARPGASRALAAGRADWSRWSRARSSCHAPSSPHATTATSTAAWTASQRGATSRRSTAQRTGGRLSTAPCVRNARGSPGCCKVAHRPTRTTPCPEAAHAQDEGAPSSGLPSGCHIPPAPTIWSSGQRSRPRVRGRLPVVSAQHWARNPDISWSDDRRTRRLFQEDPSPSNSGSTTGSASPKSGLSAPTASRSAS